MTEPGREVLHCFGTCDCHIGSSLHAITSQVTSILDDVRGSLHTITSQVSSLHCTIERKLRKCRSKHHCLLRETCRMYRRLLWESLCQSLHLSDRVLEIFSEDRLCK